METPKIHANANSIKIHQNTLNLTRKLCFILNQLNIEYPNPAPNNPKAPPSAPVIVSNKLFEKYNP